MLRFFSALLLIFGAAGALGAACTSKTLSASGGDDAPALLSAVTSCDTVVIPKATTLNINTRLNMTGVANKHINLQGTLKFTPNLPYWEGNGFFIPFQTQITFWLLGGKNILFDGGGTLDGQGQAWYDAFAKNSSLLRPITLTIFQASNVTVQNIRMINSPEWFNLVNEGTDIVFSNITLNATSTSKNGAKNTDGWDIYRSDRVVIQNSNINNGDDCVSFKPNSTNILVSNLQCNGSHGISVGSLGQFPGMFDIVENVTSTNVHISNAENGARIKCWAGANVGSGIVRNVTFADFVTANVDNPVIIDQCYMTDAAACSANPSNTLIQDVVFSSISGTSSGSTVASLSCSPDGRCANVTVDGLSVKPPKGTAKYTCQNVDIEGSSATLFGTCKTT